MKRPLTRSVCLLALAAVPVLAACGSDDGTTSAASSAGGAVSYQKAGKPAAAAAPSAGGIQVALKNSQFAPAAINAKVGQTVTWKNTDAIAHTVTASANAKFDSGTLEPGGTFSYVTKRAGTISYVCDFHPGMTGTITVQ
jgi:plastocyanin